MCWELKCRSICEQRKRSLLENCLAGMTAGPTNDPRPYGRGWQGMALPHLQRLLLRHAVECSQAEDEIAARDPNHLAAWE